MLWLQGIISNKITGMTQLPFKWYNIIYHSVLSCYIDSQVNIEEEGCDTRESGLFNIIYTWIDMLH